MKNLSVVLSLLLSLFASTSYAVPVLLEKNHTNYAWGYQNQGCFVDQSGYVYTYDVSKGAPIAVASNRLTQGELNNVQQLLEKAKHGKFTQERLAADAGTTLWSGMSYGTKVQLKEVGDYVGKNSAPEAAQLVELIEKLCK